VALLLLVVFGILELLHLSFGHEMPPDMYRLPYLGQFGVLALLSLVGVALGLVLSACVPSPDRASTLLPYVLIPQIILGGAIIAIKGQPLRFLSDTLSPVFWAYQGIHRGSENLPDYHPMHQYAPPTVAFAFLALTIHLFLLLLATACFLKKKDV
jgi:ABC-type transport system involved in multi-copper enzyme maturation permease subunit